MSSASRESRARWAVVPYWIAAAAVWSVLVLWTSANPNPLRFKDAKTFATELVGPISARYLAYCPLPLISFFAGASVVRHLVALIFAVMLRAHAPDRTFFAVLGSVLRLCAGWGTLCAAGVLAVTFSSAGGERHAWAWSSEIGWVTFVAAGPALGLAFACARIRSGWFWLAAPALTMLQALFTVGWSGARLPPLFPGVIESALTSGIATQRAQALLACAAWLFVGAATTFLGARRHG